MLELLFQVDSFLLDDNEIESEESNEDPEDCLDEDEDCLDEDVNTDDDDEESEDLEVKTVIVQFPALRSLPCQRGVKGGGQGNGVQEKKLQSKVN